MMTVEQKTRFCGFRAPIDRVRPSVLTAVLHQLRDASHLLASTSIASDSPTADNSGVMIERRRFMRRKSSGNVRIIPRRDISIPEEHLLDALQFAPHCGRMRDLSMNGVAFVLNKPLGELATLWLRLENEYRDFAVIRPARVVRIVKTEKEHWKIMCRFDHFLPHSDVCQLGHDLC